MPTQYFRHERVMVMGSSDFIRQIAGLLETVSNTKQGGSMFAYFGSHAPNVTRANEQEIAVAIREQESLPHAMPIKTSTFGSWTDTGPSFRGDSQQPLIKFPAFKTGRNILAGGGSMEISDEGVLNGHVDFPKGTGMDVVLFHEFCHAYLIQIGLGQRLQGSPPDEQTHQAYLQGGGRPLDIAENVEEQIVSGLLAGRGLICCENMYRAERGLPPRISYGVPSVAIREDKELTSRLASDTFTEVWRVSSNDLYRRSGKAGAISHVLAENGYTTLAKAMEGVPEAAVYGHKVDPKVLFADMTSRLNPFVP